MRCSGGLALLTPLLKGFKAATRPADRRTPWQWCESHIVVDNTSPMPGRWRSDNALLVKEPMEVVADNRVSDIAIKCSAQSSKTQTLLNLACWCVSEDPGPAMWVMSWRIVEEFLAAKAALRAGDFARQNIRQRNPKVA